MNKENVLNKNMCDYSKANQIMQIILICMGALVVPTFLAKILTIIFGQNSFIAMHSQIIVGTIVNTSLIVAAMNIKGWKKIMGIITLPSISAIFGGYVFMTASKYNVYMIPAIWLGNFAIVYLYKVLLLNKKLNYFITGFIAVVVKVAIIFSSFSALNLANLFPEKIAQNLQNAMGYTQLITALIAMIISYTLYIANKKVLKEK